MIFDPQNMGLETFFSQLSVILADGDIVNNRFAHNGGLICIKMARGTSGQLFDIANHFLHIFPKIKTPIRN
jgi:hypothetical protein